MAVSAMAKEYVRVVESATCGRKLVATSRFAPGQCILEELPYAYTLYDKEKELYCGFCLKKSSSLLRCSRCKYVRYCNKSCQQSDWTRYRHKHHCKKLKEIHAEVPHLAPLLSEIIEKSKQRPHPYTRDDENRFSITVDQLVSHHDKLIKKLAEEDGGLESTLSLFKDWIVCESEPERSTLLEMLGATTCNSLTICDNDLDPIAVGLYLSASMLNHSCAPNCACVFDGRTLYIRTTKDVKEGEECTIAYKDDMNPVNERRASLEKQYHFTCECMKCVEEIKASDPVDDIQDIQGLMKSSGQIQDAVQSKDWDNVLKLCEPYLKPMDPSRGLTYHYLLVNVIERVFEVCVYTKKWEKAVEIGELIMEPFKKHFGPYSAKLGMHFLTMVDKLLYLKRLKEARHYLKEAKRILEVTHGPQHSLMLTKVQELHALAHPPSVCNFK